MHQPFIPLQWGSKQIAFADMPYPFCYEATILEKDAAGEALHQILQTESAIDPRKPTKEGYVVALAAGLMAGPTRTRQP